MLSVVNGVTEAQSKDLELRANMNSAVLNRHSAKVVDNAIWEHSNNKYSQIMTLALLPQPKILQMQVRR